MSKEAIVPCFVCGTTLENVFPNLINQPSEGTELRSYGHYGSTFWDSFDGEEIVLNICDDCLNLHTDRIVQHKRYRRIKCEGHIVGREWLDREMVPWNGQEEVSDPLEVDIEDLGRPLTTRVEWRTDIEKVKSDFSKMLQEKESYGQELTTGRELLGQTRQPTTVGTGQSVGIHDPHQGV